MPKSSKARKRASKENGKLGGRPSSLPHPTVTKSFVVFEYQVEAMKDAAKQEGLSLSEFVREAIDMKLEDLKRD